MKKLYEKSEIWFAVLWIIAYCVLMSVGDNLSKSVGIEKIITLPITIVLSSILFIFVKKNGLSEKYGLCKPQVSSSKMLFYIPLILIISTNLWCGVALNYSVIETVLYILSIFFVGFLEEMIFRGLLFKEMLKDNVPSAIIVSSVTFGLGHIINLINGSGAELLPNILQVIYATAVGFMLVMIFYRTKSIIPCIALHSLVNMTSVLGNQAVRTDEIRIFSCIALVVISGAYALYITFAIKPKEESIKQ